MQALSLLLNLEMFIFIVILALVLLVAISFTALRPKRDLPPGAPRFQLSDYSSQGLFGNQLPISPAHTNSERCKSLLDRAEAGDVQALDEAHRMGDNDLYGRVLESLIEHSRARQETLEALVSHILENDGLRANSNLATRLIERFNTSPDRRRTVELLHVAALADDAATFERAVDTILQLWSEGLIHGLSAEDLREILESEYWVIASEARRSGAGFALRQRLADVRRQLAIANRRA